MAKLCQRFVGQHRQRPHERILRGRIGADRNVQPPVFTLQECGNRPIAAVALRSEHAAVLQVGQRLQQPGAFFDSTDLLTADTGEIDHRNAVIGQAILWQGAG